MFRNRSVSTHQFAMVPRADIPRSSFRMQKTHKSCFDAGYLVPVFLDEILPGDTYNVNMTAFCRLATPIFPFMDNLYLESFFFFVPNRLIWDNWERFMGAQDNPASSISFVIPQVDSPAAGYAVGSIYDHMGVPTVGQATGGAAQFINALPFRAYNLIWNEWFRDQNLQNSLSISAAGVDNPGDGPDGNAIFTLQRRGKRHDYFTGCLPWPQKGNTAVTLPLGSTAPVVSDGAAALFRNAANTRNASLVLTTGSNVPTWANAVAGATSDANWGPAGTTTTGLRADLSAATAATINSIRQAFQIQRLLERDARGGTRYKETVLAHFGVLSPDARLDRPEYLGGGSTPIQINPVAQTSATGLTGGTAPIGSLAGFATGLARHGFTQSFTEHGYVIGLVNVRADLTYQQGLRKLFSRSTRYDFYFPVFAMLGEQAVLNKEIYYQGAASPANDALVFGYQERWAEYRYNPSTISGLMRSTAASTIDPWHLAQRFVGLPTLNTTFIQDDPPIARVVAVGAGALGQQMLFDSFFDIKAARPMPLYSVPGMIDHF